MTSIIFGINGQDGYYLKQILEKSAHKVIGVSRSDGDWIKGDVANYELVSSLIKLHKPDYIFHLAANSTTHHSGLFSNHEAISTGTLNILESVKLHSFKTRVFLSGSAMQFKNDGLPINEKTAFEASSPYSVARIQSAYAGRYYRDKLGLQVYIGYFFNHDSPLRSERHVNQKIIQSVKRIASGNNEKLALGDISIKKEFTFAGDVAEAIWLFIQNNIVSEAVIGSGIAYSIEEWVNICFNYFDLDWKPYVTFTNDFRKEYDILVSDPTTLTNLGWKPTMNIEMLAKCMIEYPGK